MSYKPYSDWTGELNDYLAPGDVVDQEMIDYIRGVAPLVERKGFLQYGEASCSDPKGQMHKTFCGNIYLGHCHSIVTHPQTAIAARDKIMKQRSEHPVECFLDDMIGKKIKCRLLENKEVQIFKFGSEYKITQANFIGQTSNESRLSKKDISVHIEDALGCERVISLHQSNGMQGYLGEFSLQPDNSNTRSRVRGYSIALFEFNHSQNYLNYESIKFPISSSLSDKELKKLVVAQQQYDYVINSIGDSGVIEVDGNYDTVSIKGDDETEVFLQGDEAVDFIKQASVIYNDLGHISMDEAYAISAYQYVDLLSEAPAPSL